MKFNFIFIIVVALNAYSQPKETKLLIYGGVSDDFIIHGPTETDKARKLHILKDGVEKVLWSGGNYIQRHSIAPNSEYLAFVETQVKENRNTHFMLFVLDLSGKIIARADSGVEYSWSPDGQSIVYVKGNWFEMGEGFRPTGAEILDLKTKRVQGLGFKTYDLSWSMTDSLIYYIDFETGKVKAYDPITGNSRLTMYNGIYFSPDGSYYFRPNYEGGGFKLYTKENVDITEKFLKATGAVYPEVRWLDKSRLLVIDANLTRNDTHQNFIYDVSKNEAKVFEGKVVGSTPKRNQIGIFQNGLMKIEDLTKH